MKELTNLELLMEYMEQNQYFIGNDLLAKYNELLQKEKNEQLTLTDVVSSAFLVQHKETLINYGLFSTREKAENYINKNTDLFGIQEVKIA